MINSYEIIYLCNYRFSEVWDLKFIIFSYYIKDKYSVLKDLVTRNVLNASTIPFTLALTIEVIKLLHISKEVFKVVFVIHACR